MAWAPRGCLLHRTQHSVMVATLWTLLPLVKLTSDIRGDSHVAGLSTPAAGWTQVINVLKKQKGFGIILMRATSDQEITNLKEIFKILL